MNQSGQWLVASGQAGERCFREKRWADDTVQWGKGEVNIHLTRQVNRVTIASEKIAEPLTFAVVSDLHNAPYDDALPTLAEADAILIVGDLVNRHTGGYELAARFLRDVPDIAPTFYALGNHEWKFRRRDAYWPLVEQSRVTVLDNRCVDFHGVTLGGLSSAPRGKVDCAFLADMAKAPGFSLLMCHHPEYFSRYVAPYAIDLTVAGHAHGGQVQVFGQGLYAPDQGLLPRWTHGFYFDGRLLVSRGMTNSSHAPRWNNPCELILLRLQSL